MPMAHEQAAIDAARGRRRERLIKAAELLDRARAEYPKMEYVTDVPAALQPAVRDASRAFRYDSRFGFRELVLLVFLGVGLGAAYVKPVRVFRCDGQGEGLARCLVSERIFGLVPREQRVLEGIARTESHSGTVETYESGRINRSTVKEETLALSDASGRALWSSSEQGLLGASFSQVANDIDALRSGAAKGPLLRIQVCWPILIVSSLLTWAFFNALFRHVGLALRDRELIPASVYEQLFARVGLLLPLLVCGFAWVVAGLGSDPPAFVGGLLGLA